MYSVCLGCDGLFLQQGLFIIGSMEGLIVGFPVYAVGLTVAGMVLGGSPFRIGFNFGFCTGLNREACHSRPLRSKAPRTLIWLTAVVEYLWMGDEGKP